MAYKSEMHTTDWWMGLNLDICFLSDNQRKANQASYIMTDTKLTPITQYN